MMMFVFAVLIVTAVIAITWGTTAVALRQSQQEQVTMEESGPESGWSITETGAAPGWSVTPAHLRMW
jgi:hypothetical protein